MRVVEGPQKRWLHGGCSGGRGRQQQGMQSPGAPGAMPPGLGQQRQYQQHRGWSGQDGSSSRYQNGEQQSELVVGTRLEGFVDHVREKFGFIRCLRCSPQRCRAVLHGKDH